MSVSSGTLGERLGWRVPYLAAAALVLILAGVLVRTLPRTVRTSRRPYPALLLEPLRLLRREPALRRSCLYQATVFGAFSAVWTCLALLLAGPAYGLGPQVVLLAGLALARQLLLPHGGNAGGTEGPSEVNPTPARGGRPNVGDGVRKPDGVVSQTRHHVSPAGNPRRGARRTFVRTSAPGLGTRFGGWTKR